MHKQQLSKSCISAMGKGRKGVLKNITLQMFYCMYLIFSELRSCTLHHHEWGCMCYQWPFLLKLNIRLSIKITDTCVLLCSFRFLVSFMLFCLLLGWIYLCLIVPITMRCCTSALVSVSESEWKTLRCWREDSVTLSSIKMTFSDVNDDLWYLSIYQ